ncbi:hypothetical protein Tco_0857194 [Tanacetum coccineum]|uniref:Transposase n=1 Tax=Tanacetum coccineum TaxID=301880 RepID=A0ABQ5B8X7_9ASTR
MIHYSQEGRIADLDANEDIYLVNVQTDEDMFGVNDLDGDEVIVESVDVVKTVRETRSMVEEVTAVTIPLKSAKSKADKVVIQEPNQGTTTPTLTTITAAITITAVSTRPKQKGLLFMNKSKHLHQQFLHNNHHRSRFRTRAKVEADYQLAQRLQAQEQDELTNEEKARLFVQFLEQRRKHFAAKRVEEKRNIPPTRAQQRSTMCTYLKNMEGWKPKSLKNKSFANIQELFDKAIKRVNTFVDYRTELVEENDGDDVTINATPLSTKSSTIVDYKIHKEGKKSYFQIIRAGGNSQMYLTFGKMLKNFDKEDLEVLWSIVKAIFKKTDPVNYMDDFLLLNLKTMFEHHVKDNVWKNQQGLVKVLNWKLYDSCGVHCVTM